MIWRLLQNWTNNIKLWKSLQFSWFYETCSAKQAISANLDMLLMFQRYSTMQCIGLPTVFIFLRFWDFRFYRQKVCTKSQTENFKIDQKGSMWVAIQCKWPVPYCVTLWMQILVNSRLDTSKSWNGNPELNFPSGPKGWKKIFSYLLQPLSRSLNIKCIQA